jgi:metal-responsive CopG/Arc/MetJ family transcriptional regulator
MESERSESVSVNLNAPLLDAIDKICEEWGINSRAAIIELLLAELLIP